MKIKNPKLCGDLNVLEMWRNIVKYRSAFICSRPKILLDSEDEGTTFRRNIRKYPTAQRLVPEYMSSASPLWEPQNLETRIREFYAHGSVHRESTLKCSNNMTLFVQYSDSSTTTAGRVLFFTTRCCNYSLFKLLMMGECFTRNM
jgi:hypothetical protein